MSCRFDMPRIGTTGVFWDLNTCPVPAGINPGSVRRCIESSLRKYFGESRPVTIFALGNLQYISRVILEAISSSGIPCYHSPCGWANLSWLLSEWSNHTPYGATILLISSNNSWCNGIIQDIIDDNEFRVLRAFPKDLRPSFLDYPPVDEKEWDWETFLINDSEESMEETSLQIVKDDPAWLCFICRSYGKSWDVFINHVKTEKHIKGMFSCARYDEYGKPVHFCQVCNYPAYDDHDIDIHYNSDEHKQNKKLADKEEDCESRKRTREEDLLNEAIKKR